MEYWDGTFKFEYDSYENENYVEPVNPEQKVRELEAKLDYVSIMTGVEL